MLCICKCWWRETGIMNTIERLFWKSKGGQSKLVLKIIPEIPLKDISEKAKVSPNRYSRLSLKYHWKTILRKQRRTTQTSTQDYSWNTIERQFLKSKRGQPKLVLKIIPEIPLKDNFEKATEVNPNQYSRVFLKYHWKTILKKKGQSKLVLKIIPEIPLKDNFEKAKEVSPN